MSDKYLYDYTPIKKTTPDGRKITIYVPFIKVEVIFPLQKSFYTSALVDSGADDSLFAKEIAEHHGIKFPEYPEYLGTGAGGTKFPVWEQPVDVRFQEIKFRVKKWTPTQDQKTGTMVSSNLLGREDFFRKFRVSFNQRKKKMEIRLY